MEKDKEKKNAELEKEMKDCGIKKDGGLLQLTDDNFEMEKENE